MSLSSEKMPEANIRIVNDRMVVEYPNFVWNDGRGAWDREDPKDVFLSDQGWRWRKTGALCESDVADEIDAELARRAFEDDSTR